MPAKTLFETDTRKMHRPAYGVGATGASRSVLSTEGLSHAIGGVPTPAATGGGAIPRPRGYEPTRFPGITPPRPGLSSPVAINLPYNRQLPVSSPPQHSPADQPSYGDSYRPQIAPSQMPGPASRGIATLPPSPFQGRQPAAPPAPAMPGVYPNQPHQIDVPPVPYAPPTVPGPQQPIPNVQHPYEGLGLTEQAFIGGQGNLPTPNRSAIPRINQYKQDYRQEHLGGLYDAVNELANNNRYAAGVTPPPFNPLATPISGPGIYGQAVNAGGLMNNAEAQQFQRNVGYMPSTTVGGAFGAPGSQPLPFERTPATGAQIDSYLGQNPNGRFFQGAQAGMISTPRGQRAGFLGPGALPEIKENTDRANQMMVNKGYSNDNGRLINRSPNSPEAQAARERLGSAERKQYLDSRKQTLAGRRSQRVANSQARGEARRLRQGNMTFEERLAAMNPAAAQGRAAAEAQAKAFADNSAADRGVREKLGLAEVKQRKTASENTLKGKRLDAGQPEEGAKPLPDLPKIAAAPNLTSEQKAAVHERASADDIHGAVQELKKAGVQDEGKRYAAIAEVTGKKPWEVEVQDKWGFFRSLGQGYNTLSEGLGNRLESVFQFKRPNNIVGPSRRVGPDGKRTIPASPEWIEGQKKKAYKKSLLFS